MATRKVRSIDERLADLQEKKKQIEAQEKQLKARQTQEERKKRTKFLIELGGAVCKVLKEDTQQGDDITSEDVERLIAFLKSQNARGNYFTRAMGRTPKEKEQTINTSLTTQNSTADELERKI